MKVPAKGFVKGSVKETDTAATNLLVVDTVVHDGVAAVRRDDVASVRQDDVAAVRQDDVAAVQQDDVARAPAVAVAETQTESQPDGNSEPDHNSEPDGNSEPDHNSEPDGNSEPDHNSEPDGNSEPIVSNFREPSEPLAARPSEIQNSERTGRSSAGVASVRRGGVDGRADAAATNRLAADTLVQGGVASVRRGGVDGRADAAATNRLAADTLVQGGVSAVTVPIDDAGRSAVVMDGRGWVFLGAPAGVSFYSKQREGAAERFAFSVQEPGEYELDFHRQNLANGEIEVRNVAVSFVSPAQFLPGDESSNEIPAIAQGNAVDQANSPIVVSASAMEETALLHEANGDIANAIKTLEDLGRDFPAHRYMDRARYNLARLYELPGEQRNIRGALSIYRDIVNVHPFSRYIENAKERIHYIQRTYYKVF